MGDDDDDVHSPFKGRTQLVVEDNEELCGIFSSSDRLNERPHKLASNWSSSNAPIEAQHSRLSDYLQSDFSVDNDNDDDEVVSAPNELVQ